MPNIVNTKNADKYTCEICDFVCSKKSNYDIHISTQKHQSLTNANIKNAEHICQCGKKYKHRSSLSKHKKNCSSQGNNLDYVKKLFMQAVTKISDAMKNHADTSCNDTDLMQQIMKQMQEQQDDLRKRDELLEQMLQKLGSTTINANNSNNNFNINMFLNNECKDALNFSDFINNIQVSREDLQNNARLGFVEGISKIFIDNLSQLTIYERPIHCTDTKRETVYIKDDNCWSKENEKVKQLLNNSIQAISRKSVNSLTQWKSENDDYNDVNSDFSELCLHIHKHSIAGYDRDKFYPKVMKKITGHVHLTKRQGLPSLGRTLLSG